MVKLSFRHFMVICLFLLFSIAIVAQTSNPGHWVRSVEKDKLTGISVVSWSFIQTQLDGRNTSMYFFCSNGKMNETGVRYFTGLHVYFDGSINSGPYSDPNSFLVVLRYRGETGKIYTSSERASVADSARVSFTGHEMELFGHTGTLVLEYGDDRGHLVIDTLQQVDVTNADKQTMNEDCFSRKTKQK